MLFDLVGFIYSLELRSPRLPPGSRHGGTADSRPPRLVVDSTVCGTNGNCIINEHQCMPSAKDVLRTFPLRNNRHELSALGLDVRAAHKRVVIKESHRGLLGFSHRMHYIFTRLLRLGLYSQLTGGVVSAHFGSDFCIKQFLWLMHSSYSWMIFCLSSERMFFH